MEKNRARWGLSFLAAVMVSSIPTGAFAGPMAMGGLAGAASGVSLRALPLHFEEEPGQGPEAGRYLARGRGFQLSLAPGEASLRVSGLPEPVRMRWPGGDPSVQPTAMERQETTYNYLLGGDPGRWRRDVPTYGRVRYEQVYPGIDLVFYGREGMLEYDFVLAPGADPSTLRLAFDGAEGVEVDDQGNLVIRTAIGEIRQRPPRLYQETLAGTRTVSGSYVLREDGTVGFGVGDYDPLKPLVIDPVLVYSNIWGKTRADKGRSVLLDSRGNIYLLAEVEAEIPDSSLGEPDLVVLKLNPEGNRLIAGTFVGGSAMEQAQGMAVDAAGNIFVAANSWSFDKTTTPENEGFPLTSNAYSTSEEFAPHAVFFQLDPEMKQLLYSSRLPNAELAGVAVDRNGQIYLTGRGGNALFPITPGAVQTEDPCGWSTQPFIAKFDTRKSGKDSLIYSTYITGKGCGESAAIAVDDEGNAYIAGIVKGEGLPVTSNAPQQTHGGFPVLGEVFVAKVDPTGTQRLFTTYLGGPYDEYATALAVDPNQNIYVTGWAYLKFPTTPGVLQPEFHPGDCQVGWGTTVCSDAFVTKYARDGSVVYSTYLGGVYWDNGQGIAADAEGNAYVVGETSSLNFPRVNPVTEAEGGTRDAFVAVLDPKGTQILFSTLMGGTDEDRAQGVAVDAARKAIYVTGYTKSKIGGPGADTFPKVNPLEIEEIPGGGAENTFHGDVFLTKIALDEVSPNPGDPPMPGDVNGDSKVTLVDAIALLKAVAGIDTLTPRQQLAADVSGDGKANILDVIALLRIVAGLQPAPGGSPDGPAG